jgi:hypothetical protein
MSMSDFFAKVRAWTRLVLLCAMAIFVILLLILNRNTRVDVYLVFTTCEKASLLLVLFLTAVFSIFGWWLLWVVVRTLRQLREARDRALTQKTAKDLADMKAKAAMLQTRPPDQPPAGGV